MQEYLEVGDKKAKLNPLKAAERAKTLTSNKLDEVRKAAQEGRLIAWGGGPTEILEPMGISCVRFGGYCQLARRSGFAPLLCEVAEAEGFSEEICSYLRIMFGLALLMKRGDVDSIPEALRVPRPQFVMSGGDCWNQAEWAHALGEIFDVPVLLLDMPFTYQGSHWERDMHYAAGQLEDFVAFLEEMTGRPYNWEGLKELMASYRRMNHLRSTIREANKQVPAIVDIIDNQLCGSAFDSRVAPDVLVKFYEEIKAELEERRKNGIAAVSPERCRILWQGLPFRGEERNLSRMFGERGAVAVTGFCSDKAFGDHNSEELPPDGIDIDRPLLTLAANCSRSGPRPLDWKMEQEVYRYAEGYSIDGAVLFSSQTCRPYGIGVFDMRDEIERELGIPAMVLEGDHCDPRRFSGAELENRIQAFTEMILATKC